MPTRPAICSAAGLYRPLKNASKSEALASSTVNGIWRSIIGSPRSGCTSSVRHGRERRLDVLQQADRGLRHDVEVVGTVLDAGLAAAPPCPGVCRSIDRTRRREEEGRVDSRWARDRG